MKNSFTHKEVLLSHRNYQHKKWFTLAEVISPHPISKQKIAFTLAEVLITLGIIGVVAALTIPTLIANHEKKVTITGLKKVYSELTNMIKLSENENGEISTWDFPQSTANIDETIKFINKYYIPYTNSAKVFTNRQEYYFYNLGKSRKLTYNTGFILADGTIIMVMPNIPNGYIWVFADINGFKKPNRIGRDVFVFDAYNWQSRSKYGIKFWGDAWEIEQLAKVPQISEEEIDTNRGYYECNKNNKHGYYSGYYCGAVIQKNGWQINDDYPW